MNTNQQLSYCPKCRESMIMTKDGQKCFNCVSHKPSKIVATEIPNDAAFNKALKGQGTPGTQAVTRVAKQAGSAKDALDIMEHLPMPKDEKEFKKIKKIIKQLQDLIGE